MLFDPLTSCGVGHYIKMKCRVFPGRYYLAHKLSETTARVDYHTMNHMISEETQLTLVDGEWLTNDELEEY